MKKILVIISIIVSLLVILAVYVKNNIINNIGGKFNSFTISNISGILPTRADIDVNFDIINNSSFGFSVKSFKVKIYDFLTNEYITENRVIDELAIPIGVSTHDIKLLNNEIASNLNEFLAEGEKEYRAVVSFNVMWMNVEFEQLIKL